ncbi:MAG: hypothetical protein JXP73_21670 [Deltaproteobacteria bacterium]|nr:hypothetical protein [Deltaproteobacteria bacterium]
MQKLYLAFGLCTALVACGGGDDIKRGGANESCTSHNDCQDNLLCLNNVCVASAQPAVDGGGQATPAVTSGPGESCTKTADCVAGYKCYNGTCLMAPPQTDAAIVQVPVYIVVDAGGPPTNPVLSGRGETCAQSSDCEQGLICLPLSDSTGLGVCDIATYGFTTGTKTCHAECKTDLDCCEIPLGTTGTSIEAGTVEYKSCADLRKAMSPYGGDNCSDQVSISRECFLYKTYCECTATNIPWKCTPEGRCSYVRACDPTITAEVMKGCPAKTRAGFAVPGCNATTKLCAAVAPTGGCASDDACSGMAVADDPKDTCSLNECKCLVATGACYRKCNADLDCAPGHMCDTTQMLCKPAGECTTDAYCAVKLENAGAKCAPVGDGTVKACRLPCTTDQDCSPSGLSGSSFTGTVCGADRFCGSIGCTSDDECASPTSIGSDVGSVKMFCALPVAATTVQWASAITD